MVKKSRLDLARKGHKTEHECRQSSTEQRIALSKKRERTLGGVTAKERGLVDNNNISTTFKNGVSSRETGEATTDNDDPRHLHETRVRKSHSYRNETEMSEQILTNRFTSNGDTGKCSEQPWADNRNFASADATTEGSPLFLRARPVARPRNNTVLIYLNSYL
jgi:hypothetical protein